MDCENYLKSSKSALHASTTHNKCLKKIPAITTILFHYKNGLLWLF